MYRIVVLECEGELCIRISLHQTATIGIIPLSYQHEIERTSERKGNTNDSRELTFVISNQIKPKLWQVYNNS